MELVGFGIILGFGIMGIVAIKIAQAVKPVIHVTQSQSQTGAKSGAGLPSLFFPIALLIAGVLLFQSITTPAAVPQVAQIQQPAQVVQPQVVIAPTAIPVVVEQPAPVAFPVSTPIAHVPDYWPIPIAVCGLAVALCVGYVRRKEQQKRGAALAAELFKQKAKMRS